MRCAAIVGYAIDMRISFIEIDYYVAAHSRRDWCDFKWISRVNLDTPGILTHSKVLDCNFKKWLPPLYSNETRMAWFFCVC